MRIKDVKAAVLQELYKTYEAHGRNAVVVVNSLDGDLPDAKPGAIKAVVKEFYDAGIIEFRGQGVMLTASGIEQVEDPSTEAHSLVVHAVTISGGNVQVGNNNTQNVTYSTVLQSLKEKVDSSNEPDDSKQELAGAIDLLMRHPITLSNF